MLPGIDLANHADHTVFGVRHVCASELPLTAASTNTSTLKSTCTSAVDDPLDMVLSKTTETALDGFRGEKDLQGEEEEEEVVGLVVDREYRAGEEVFSSYGPLDKSRL